MAAEDGAPAGGLATDDTAVGLGTQAVREAARGKLFGAKKAAPVRIDRYVIIDRIGAGGMGEVFAAFDPELNRKVAIKLVKPGLGGQGSEGQARMLREAQAMAQLHHPNVVTVHDVGRVGEELYIMMEFVDGPTLTRWLATEKRSWQDVVAVFAQAARGLAAVHDAGLVHRDFKPDNVMLAPGRELQVKVMDFGIARTEAVVPGEDHAPPKMLEDEPLTQTGAVVGTPAYMAPEQLRGEPADARSDQFSWCVSLYQALYGARPFEGDTFEELSDNVLAGRIRRVVGTVRVPRQVDRAVMKGLAIDPADRHASMDSLVELLSVDRRIGWRWIVGMTTLAAASGAYIAWASQGPLCPEDRSPLSGVWDSSRRAALVESFRATGSPIVERAEELVVQTLNAYADEWVTARREACQATRVRGVQSEALLDKRMACLDRRLAEVSALVDVLSEADDDIVDNAATAVAGLYPLSRCADRALLDLEIESPHDPEQARAVDDLRNTIARVDALQGLGRYRQGREIIDSAIASAADLGYPPVEAELRLRRGRMLQRTGDPGASREELLEALWLAETTKHDVAVLLIQIELTWVVGNQLNRLDEGELWGNYAGAHIERLGLAGSREESELLASIGGIQQLRGDRERAVETQTRSLELSIELLGADHPEVGISRVNIGLSLKDLGRYPEALAMIGAGAANLEAFYGPEHPQVLIAVNFLGLVYYRMGELEEAEAHHQRALDGMAKTLGEGHPDLALALNGLSNVAERRGRLDDARDFLVRAMEILEAAPTRDALRMAVLNVNTANLSMKLGRLDDAEPRYKASIEDFEGILGPDHIMLSLPHLGLGQLLMKRGRTAEAIVALERAVALADPNDPTNQAEARFALAKALWGRPKQRPRALELAREARKGFHEAPNSTADERDTIDAWLTERERPL